ncbi:MAG: hypothetical protein WCD20_18220 [Rhodomicrobium sp.]
MDETTIDGAAMGRLAKALVFICGLAHPAVSSGTSRLPRARFLKLKPGERKAALIMLAD